MSDSEESIVLMACQHITIEHISLLNPKAQSFHLAQIPYTTLPTYAEQLLPLPE